MLIISVLVHGQQHVVITNETSFPQVVFDETKNVVVLFDISVKWCFHCKEARKVFGKVAKKYQEENVEDLIFARFNMKHTDPSIFGLSVSFTTF